jgi:hypothetical protein
MINQGIANVVALKQPWFLSSPSARVISQNPERIMWEIRTFTPMMAQKLLEDMSEQQRSVRDRNVAALTKEMREGRWADLGEPFATYNSQGAVINGQHRALALVAANVSLNNITIVQVLDDAVVTCIDTGKTRQVGDMRRMAGHKAVAGSIVAAIALEAANFVQNRLRAMGTRERFELSANAPFFDELLKLHSMGRALCISQGPLAAALRCMRTARDAREPFEFFATAFRNEYVLAGSPCLPAKALANYLIRSSRAGHKTLQVKEAAACIAAWNMYRRGVNSERLRVPDEVPKALP